MKNLISVTTSSPLTSSKQLLMQNQDIDSKSWLLRWRGQNPIVVLPSNIVFIQINMQSKAGGSELNLAEDIIQITSHTLYIFCLLFFIYRLWKLRSFSMTKKYQKFFPRLRVILSILYILVSLSLFIYTLSSDFYQQDNWIDYFLGGGGGQFCINSLVFIFQLLVLRQQLLKEKPFTRCHIVFFSILPISSTARLIEVILNIKYWPSFINIIPFEACLTLLSFAMLIYWVIKLKSLPKFTPHEEIQLEDILIRDSAAIGTIPNNKIIKLINDDFPYLLPFVSIQNGDFRIVLETYTKSSEEARKRVMTEQNLQIPSSFRKTDTQFVAVTMLTKDELKSFYIMCSKFPLKEHLDIQKLPPQQLAFAYQAFLQQLLLQKKYYREEILKGLHIPLSFIENYESLLNISENKEFSSFDRTFGVKFIEDRNSIYFSIQVFKHLWVSTHYLFYIKVVVMSPPIVSFPIKRYSVRCLEIQDLEELEEELKRIIKHSGRMLVLPPIPKKQLFHWNEDQFLNRRKLEIDKYLKRLTNDCTIMKISQAKFKILQFFELPRDTDLIPQLQDQFYFQIKIIKGEITKMIIKNECVTFYEFKIYREDTEIKTIVKRYSEFNELHQQMKRWMHNIKITFTFLEMPQKVYFGSESLRHTKLASYLQNLVDIRGVGRIYAVNDFFNVGNNDRERLSDTSEIQAQSRQKISFQFKHDKYGSKTSSNFSNILNHLSRDSFD